MSKDETLKIAKSCGVKIVTSPPGRSRQMNTGAKHAEGDILLFLHADTVLPRGFDRHIRQTLQDPHIVVGAFNLKIQGHLFGLRIVEFMANVRSRWLKMPYGDQGIFLRTQCFWAVGGFPDIPIMEDFVLVKTLRKHGRVVTLPVSVVILSKAGWQLTHTIQAPLSSSDFLHLLKISMKK